MTRTAISWLYTIAAAAILIAIVAWIYVHENSDVAKKSCLAIVRRAGADGVSLGEPIVTKVGDNTFLTSVAVYISNTEAVTVHCITTCGSGSCHTTTTTD